MRLERAPLQSGSFLQNLQTVPNLSRRENRNHHERQDFRAGTAASCIAPTNPFPWQGNCHLNDSFEILGNRRRNFFARSEGFSMNRLFARGLAAFVVLFAGPAAMAQGNVPNVTPRILVLAPPTTRLDSSSVSAPSTLEANPLQSRTKPPHFSKTRFVLLSTAVYGAALADKHQTLAVRHYSWWHENDPLAKPFIRLPTPTYYAAGLAMATGVNWLGWKMAHSRRWHKLSPIPHLLAASGNLYGFHSNLP